MSQDGPVIEAFMPFDVLQEKPNPEPFPTYEPNKTPEEGVFFESLIQEFTDSAKSLDRNMVLERLQTNGFLVRPCDANTPMSDIVPQKSPSLENDWNVIQQPEKDDGVLVDYPNEKGQKINEKIILEEEVDKTLEIEKEYEELSREKNVSMPKEQSYNDDKVHQELLFDDKTIFIVCNEKKEQKAPGKEPSETIPKDRVPEFVALAKIQDWRQKLCNDFEAPFMLDDIEWKSVDHFLIAARYRHQSIVNEFANYQKALQIHKNKKYNGKKIPQDEDFEQREKQELYHALYAKFTQHPELSRILHATKDAKLLYRLNKQTKKDFTELMWLRQTLREYVQHTLKPLAEEPLPTKERRKVEKQVYDLTNVDIGQYAVQLPKYEPDVLRISSHYMNNRLEFIKNVNAMFSKLSDMPSTGAFNLMEHQRLVLNYIHHDRPYHGVLVYHNLGTGKSCTSIAVAEGMKNEKQIVVMMPASLKSNYWAELQKCGDVMYKQNQHWQRVSVEGKPEMIPILAKALSMTTEEVRKKKGAWMVNVTQPPNFKNLAPTEQQEVQTQIMHMISQKYKNIHYNANNIGTKINELGRGKTNPFDHTVVVLDEAHNFISRIVGNLRKKRKASDSIYVQIYEQMLKAKDFRIVMLSGTPIINHPQEIGVMFNLLRGGIMTWSLKLKVRAAMDNEKMRKLLDQGKCATYDYIEYRSGTLTITKNPYGFVNVNSKPRAQKNTRRNDAPIRTNNTRKQMGGFGENGVKLDSRGNIDNDAFIAQVKRILKNNDITIENETSKLEKCLPDNEDEFQKTFIRETTNYSDLKDTSTDLLKVNTLRRRILGLTSYYRTTNDKVLPRIIKDKGNVFNEIRVPMSDYQFEAYAKIRKTELDKEKKQKTMRGIQRQVNNGELFGMTSTYRVFSRSCCNFAFPTPPGRPIPKNGKISENEDLDESVLEDDKEVESAEHVEEIDPDADYNKKIAEAMGFLRDNRATVFSQEKLKVYSPKMLEILKRLKNPNNKGLHMVYSTFRTLEGIGIFQEVLHAHGYQEFKIAKKGDRWELDYKPDGRACYALYTGKEDGEMKEIIRNVFNGDWNAPNVPDSIGMELRKIASNNLYGEIVQLFMITSSGAEGINLKNTRYVHIMEPYWHNVRLEQVMGRARRINSHIDLPEDERTVQAFLYLSVMTDKQMKDDNFKEIQVNDLSKLRENTPVTTDEFLYEISQMKQKVNNQFLRIMKETAMDCQVHVQNHRNEKLVCYAPVSGHRTFADYPQLEKILNEDQNEHLRERRHVDSVSPPMEPESEPESEPSTEDRESPNQELTEKSSNGDEKLKYNSPRFISTISEKAKKMYNPNIVFNFYSKSADKYPGLGSHEKPNDLKPLYDDLAAIKDWRKKLSNFWVAPFTLDGRRWNSVEHYYQGSKFRKENPEFYHKFSLDSGSEISEDPAKAKSAGGKTGKIGGKQFRPKTIQADKDFFNTNRINEEMYVSQFAKFTTVPEMRDLLEKTKDAKLVHLMIQRAKPTEHVFFENLVVIRDLIKKKEV